MRLPMHIVDLHTHLFNAHYIPLESILANAMNRSESKLANVVARLAYALTGNSYLESHVFTVPAALLDRVHADHDAEDAVYLTWVWALTRHEMLQQASLQDWSEGNESAFLERPLTETELHPLLDSALAQLIQELSDLDYREEGLVEETEAAFLPFQRLSLSQVQVLRVGQYLSWAESVLKYALRALKKLLDPSIWADAKNYLEFVWTMIHAERDILKRLRSSYGVYQERLTVVHFMMDMQYAYELHRPPKLLFPKQLEAMHRLQSDNPQTVIGFSAFDPRRENWREIADLSLAYGFAGFKFYPAMGYLPFGHANAAERARIEAFFDYCVERDLPIFTHCTPVGFQTRFKEGLNADPKHWQAVLDVPRWHTLRLCLGHAGGGRAENRNVFSAGWLARSKEEWWSSNNFARTAAELCTRYPNVYCELGYLTELLENPLQREYLLSNLERARADARQKNHPYELLDKVAYGSDWHMPHMVNQTRQYLEVFLEIMNRPAYLDYIEQFFSGNALKYLRRV